MKTTIEIELEPFQTPNFVRFKFAKDAREDGMRDSESISLRALDALTLDQLCRQFRAEVFQKAGKKQPPEAG